MKTICDSCLESFDFTVDDIAYIDNTFVVECPGCHEPNEIDEENLSEKAQAIILQRIEDNENTVSLEDLDEEKDSYDPW